MKPSLAVIPAAGVLLWGFFLGPLSWVGQGLLLLSLNFIPVFALIYLMGVLACMGLGLPLKDSIAIRTHKLERLRSRRNPVGAGQAFSARWKRNRAGLNKEGR